MDIHQGFAIWKDQQDPAQQRHWKGRQALPETTRSANRPSSPMLERGMTREPGFYWPDVGMPVHAVSNPTVITHWLMPDKPPERLYKFVRPEYAEAFENGEVLVGSLRAFGTIEALRADSLEGVAEHRLVINTPNQPTRDEVEAAAAVGIDISPGTVGIKVDVRHQMIMEDFWTFCFSTSPVWGHPTEPARPVFEIADPRLFIETLCDVHPELNVRAQWCAGLVRYAPVSFDLMKDGENPVDPFCKDPMWSWENEARVLFMPPRREKLPQLRRQDDRLARLVRRIPQ